MILILIRKINRKFVSVRAIKGKRESGGIAPLIPNLDTSGQLNAQAALPF